MKTKLLASRSLQELFTPQMSDRGESANLSAAFQRRNFLRLTGLGVIGSATSGLWRAHEALACRDKNFAFDEDKDEDQELSAEDEEFSQLLHDRISDADLLRSRIQQLALSRLRWRVTEPTSGIITLVNRRNVPASGEIALAVVGRGRIEDLERYGYRMPPNRIETYRVDEGPSAERPGEKDWVLATSNDLQRTHMVAYV
jgi:hypothetical protein